MSSQSNALFAFGDSGDVGSLSRKCEGLILCVELYLSKALTVVGVGVYGSVPVVMVQIKGTDKKVKLYEWETYYPGQNGKKGLWKTSYACSQDLSLEPAFSGQYPDITFLDMGLGDDFKINL